MPVKKFTVFLNYNKTQKMKNIQKKYEKVQRETK